MLSRCANDFQRYRDTERGRSASLPHNHPPSSTTGRWPDPKVDERSVLRLSAVPATLRASPNRTPLRSAP
ncbi:hypothetical protein AYK61_10945 [Rhodococcus sp. SBT000017]|nr:hypothetical protein AYK61_10945 [Rhodococcus sp. SBT000017]